jgi:hypothetical protein
LCTSRNGVAVSLRQFGDGNGEQAVRGRLLAEFGTVSARELLKWQIPTPTLPARDENIPGPVEVDLVGHVGGDADGSCG